MPDLNIKIDKWQNKIKTDPDLSTFGRLKTQISSTQQVKFLKKTIYLFSTKLLILKSWIHFKLEIEIQRISFICINQPKN